jgi:4-carboxymuconolactone decarboxylase
MSGGEPDALAQAVGLREPDTSALPATTVSLVRIATLIALDAPPASYGRQVTNALEAGATAEDILGVLRAVAPHVGMARVVAAAPEIMLALGLPLPGSGGDDL